MISIKKKKIGKITSHKGENEHKETKKERRKQIICPQAPARTSNRDKKALCCFKDCQISMVLSQLDSEYRGKQVACEVEALNN